MAEQLPPQDYYPLARVRLAVRFEEFTAKDTPTPPKKPPQLRTGKDDPQLDVVTRQAKDGSSIILLVSKGAGATSPQGPAAIQPKSDDGRTHHIEGVIPKDATLCRNGIRIADTLKLTLNFADFPFDPRVIRSCGIEYFFGTIPARDFQDSIDGSFNQAGQRLMMLPDFWFDAQGRERTNLRFQGWVDKWGMHLPEEGAPEVSLECTDQTRLLLDQEAPPKLVIHDDAPLDQAIANYLANFPQFRGFALQYRPNNADRPTLKDVFAKTAYKPTLGPSPNGGEKLMVWDYITDVCGAVGHICFVDLTFLPDGTAAPIIVVQRPRTLYGTKFQGRPGDPFTGRILPSGRELIARTFTYGQNALSLEFERNFGKLEPTNIEVRAYSPKLKKTLVVRYPDKEKDRHKSLKPGNDADQKWEVVRIQGIEDEKTLRVIAQGVYEQRQRNEIAAHVHTCNLASLGGDNDDPDVLDMQAGDTIEAEVDRDSLGANTIVAVQGFSAQNAAGFLTELGYDQELAGAYAKAAANLSFPTSFRVKGVTIDWKGAEGEVEVDIELVNFIEVKSEADLPAGEEQSPDPKGQESKVEVSPGETSGPAGSGKTLEETGGVAPAVDDLNAEFDEEQFG